MKTRILMSLAAVLLLTAGVYADCGDSCGWTLQCDGNGIFQPSGERSGGDYYFNVEGSSHGSYASWAGAEWTGVSLPDCGSGCECAVTSVTVSLTQSNAGFTANGQVKMYLAPDYVEAHEGGNHTFGDWSSIEGDSTHLMDYNFIETATGDTDCYTITDSAAIAAIVDSIDDGKLVLAFAPGDSGVAATYAGIGSWYGDAPTVTLNGTCVPEPTTMGLLGFGAVGALLKRKRNN